jgi:hypothetical protein
VTDRRQWRAPTYTEIVFNSKARPRREAVAEDKERRRLRDEEAKRRWMRGPRRGPKPGTVARYRRSDLQLCPEIDALMRNEQISLHEACMRLAEQGRVAGRNTTVESSARRLAKVYKTISN